MSMGLDVCFVLGGPKDVLNHSEGKEPSYERVPLIIL